MKLHINCLYSMYPEQIEKLTAIVAHKGGTNKSAVIRNLIDKEYKALEIEMPPTSPESNSDASN